MNEKSWGYYIRNAVILMSLVPCLCCGGCYLDYWWSAHEEVQRVTSPDGQIDAVVDRVNPSALDDYFTNIHLVARGARLWFRDTDVQFQGSPGKGWWVGNRFFIQGRRDQYALPDADVVIRGKHYRITTVDFEPTYNSSTSAAFPRSKS